MEKGKEFLEHGDSVLDFDFDEKPDEQIEDPLKIETFDSNILSGNLRALFPCDADGSMRIMTFKVEAKNDYASGTTFNLCRILQGQVRIFGHLSKLIFNLSCKSAVLGWGKYKNVRQEITPANPVGFGKVEKLKGSNTFLSQSSTGMIRLNSLEGVYLFCTVEGAGKKGDSIEGYLLYVK